jgi:hypothetical protein
MEIELKSLLELTLKEFGKITFDFCYVANGCEFELSIGQMENEDCGLIYDHLYQWMVIDTFIHFMINHGAQSNFKGFIELLDNRIIFTVQIYGTEYSHIEFNEVVLREIIGIDINTMVFSELELESFHVHFEKLNNLPLENLIVEYYNKDWKRVELDDTQIWNLINFLEKEIDNSLPFAFFDFECEIDFKIECKQNSIEYFFQSSPIQIDLDRII